MLLDDLPTNTGKIEEWTKYRREYETMITTNSHQHVIYKDFNVHDATEDQTKI